MFNWQYILFVAIGGMLGSVLRYMTSVVFQKLAWEPIWPTFAVNMAGSLLFGIVLAWLSKSSQYAEQLRMLLLVGFCGGFTTFSALSFEAWQLLKNHQYAKLLFYYSGSAVFGIIAIAAGFLIYQSSSE